VAHCNQRRQLGPKGVYTVYSAAALYILKLTIKMHFRSYNILFL
jgi:hypothetical protein